ncbi:MAG: hypothetical protein WA152_00020 [Microgenomates group bacterium]
MQPLLTKFQTTKLTRKEFLTYLGVLTLGILGISSILKLLTEINPKQQKQTAFGKGAYGV